MSKKTKKEKPKEPVKKPVTTQDAPPTDPAKPPSGGN